MPQKNVIRKAKKLYSFTTIKAIDTIVIIKITMTLIREAVLLPILSIT
jgi:hypothetical protein